ncbi:hypothetical protein Clacol_000991 [Clathrus columnatus]|uniref:MADF domain-containing protein n=1 Tax=Clathrus columnatus TaxID=1419009 RepID=A0AAV4ZY87_9AGAM|nr:hypothetical protein Clacol_000991 [Clathrus columnatus]
MKRAEESDESSSSEEDTLPHDASAVARRDNLLRKLKSILLSHIKNTRPPSFYLLLAHPPIKPNNPPVLSKLQSTSIMNFPNFGSYFRTNEEHICHKWKEYAAAVERKHVFIQKLKKLIKLDENEYPQVPAMGYDLKELGEALTIYLEQTWYKLHEHTEDITITTFPWSDVKLNSTGYLRTSALPSSLIPFQAPNKMSTANIVQLHSFLEDNADKPFPERFPFIIQPEIFVGLKRARSIVVNNKTQLQAISQDASSMGEMSDDSDEVTPTKCRRRYKS